MDKKPLASALTLAIVWALCSAPADAGAQDLELLASFIPGGAQDAPSAPRSPRGGIAVVVLDPGHGGESVGARGSAGTLEKDLVLALAQKAKVLIEERLGLKVVLTRTADYPVDLAERSAAANAVRDGIFISLHASGAFRSEPGGVEVLVMAYPARHDVLGTSSGRGGPVASGGGALMAPIRWDRAQEDFIPESAELAARVSNRLTSSLSGGDRGVRRAPMAVLAAVRMPAVLVEVGFLSNPEQEIRLNRPAYQDQLAEAVVQAIADHNRGRLLGGEGESLR